MIYHLCVVSILAGHGVSDQPAALDDSVAAHLAAHFARCWAMSSRGRSAIEGLRDADWLARALLEQFADMGAQPNALKLTRSHILGAADDAAAGRFAAEAVEWLGHLPLGGWVEELGKNTCMSLELPCTA